MTKLLGFLKTLANYFIQDDSSHDTSMNEIEIVQSFTDNHSYRMPLTTDDVRWYLSQLKGKNPSITDNIERIELTSREVFFTDDVFASYNPYVDKTGKAVIKLYPIRFDFEKNLYLIVNPNGKKAYLDEENARQIQLFNLGHEIGHNVVFKEEGRLHGADVEMKCDLFSEGLGLSLNANRLYSQLF